MKLPSVLVLLAGAAFGAAGASAQSETKLTASDGAVGDWFGYSVSASGDVALVGAPYDNDLGDRSGSAYVYHFDGSGWIEEQKLTASDGAADDNFGNSVSVSGDVAIVGALWDDDLGDRSGSAYVYRFDGSGRVEEQKLTASDGAAEDNFGYSVSVSGDVAVVGADWDDDLGDRSGSAYVYRFDGSGWVEEQKLIASDGAASDWFGRSVTVSGDVAVVGAVGDGNLSGSAYVYRFDGSAWLEEQKLTASEGAAGDWFGNSVSVSGDVAVVGAWGDDDKGAQSGSVYVYRFDGSGWVEEQKLIASDGAASDNFGISVSVSGDVALVGAFSDDDLGEASGSAYVYRVGSGAWVEERKLTASDGAAGDWFGNSVSVSGDVALVGAPYDDDLGEASGSAYVYQVIAVAIEDTGVIPSAFALGQNYPNPFNPATSITYALRERSRVRLTIFDVLGREVRVLVDRILPAGEYVAAFDAGELPSGTYLYRLEAGGFVGVRSMTLLR